MLSTRFRRLPSVGALGRGALAEAAAQLDRVFLWIPVAFGLGAAIYLGLKSEPPLWPAAAAAALLGVGAVAVAWRGGAAGAARRAGAGWRSPPPGSRSPSCAATMWPRPIVPAEPRRRRGRRLRRRRRHAQPDWPAAADRADRDQPSDHGSAAAPRPDRHADRATSRRPARRSGCRRCSIRRRRRPRRGPTTSPATPGSPARAAVGLARGPPQLIAAPAPPWRLRLAMAINAFRWRTAERLAGDMDEVMGGHAGDAAGLAVAVTTSHQDWLSQPVANDLRAAGLAHMLAIAGLHTAALSGFVFFALRFLVSPPGRGWRCACRQEGGGRRRADRGRRLPGAVRRARAGPARGDHRLGGVHGDPAGPAGDQPALAGAGGADHPVDRAGGGGAAGLRDVVLRHRRAGGAGRDLAAQAARPTGLPWPLALPAARPRLAGRALHGQPRRRRGDRAVRDPALQPHRQLRRLRQPHRRLRGQSW